MSGQSKVCGVGMKRMSRSLIIPKPLEVLIFKRLLKLYYKTIIHENQPDPESIHFNEVPYS